MNIQTAPAFNTSPHVTSVKPSRVLSLDVLRGLTIGFMILVNNNGDEAHAYWPLKHAAWNGFTPTDLVFPTFLFLVGVAIVFSTASRSAQGESVSAQFVHILRRSIILIALGFVVNNFPLFHLHNLRFYGVLPRIGICYFIVATLYLIKPTWRDKAVLAVVALVGYWVLMRFVPVPGSGVPGHDVPLLDRDANIVAWLDRQIFSSSHLYEHTRDPEGLLSTLPALGTTLMGLLTGCWLRTNKSIVEKTRGVAIAGASSVILGACWNVTFPINKKLWTSSYVLFAGGLSLLLLALCMWLVDVRSTRQSDTRPAWLTPFLVFGSNAIAAYMLSELLVGALWQVHVQPGVNVLRWTYNGIHSIVPDAAFASLVYSIGYVAVCWLVMYPLYRRRIFIKI